MVTDEMELDLLRRRAYHCGMYVERHKRSDICGGDLYLQERRSRGNPKPPSILRFATADQVHDALREVEAAQMKRV